MSIPSTMVLSRYNSPSSQLLASASYDGKVSVWDLSRKEDAIHILTVKVVPPVIGMLFSPDAKHMLAAHAQTLSLISIERKRVVWTKGPFLNGIPIVEWDPQSNKLRSKKDGTIYEVSGPQYLPDDPPTPPAHPKNPPPERTSVSSNEDTTGSTLEDFFDRKSKFFPLKSAIDTKST